MAALEEKRSSALSTEKMKIKKGKMTATEKDDSLRSAASVRSRILDRLAKAVNDAPPGMNRSPELVPLTLEWESTKKNLRLLVSLAKNYAETTQAMHTSRSKLVNHFAILSEKSPLFDSIGKKSLDRKSTQVLKSSTTKRTTVSEIIDSSKETAISVGTLQMLAATQELFLERDFRAQIIEYAVEWEKAITEKVGEELKKVRGLQTTRTHYEKKVEQLRQWANALEEKGKENPPTKAEKLVRNEGKLKEAFELHEEEAGRLCLLLEEVTTNGWKDLYNLVKNYCRWESYRVDQESGIYSELMPITLESMKTAFKKKLNSTTKKKKKSKQPPSAA